MIGEASRRNGPPTAEAQTSAETPEELVSLMMFDPCSVILLSDHHERSDHVYSSIFEAHAWLEQMTKLGMRAETSMSIQCRST